eukprot:UN33269
MNTYENHLKWLKIWFKHLKDHGLKDAIVYCNGFGGSLMLNIIAEQPELFAGLILANTALWDNNIQKVDPKALDKRKSDLKKSNRISKSN